MATGSRTSHSTRASGKASSSAPTWWAWSGVFSPTRATPRAAVASASIAPSTSAARYRPSARTRAATPSASSCRYPKASVAVNAVQ